MVLLIALGTFLATLTGGYLALKFSDKLHLILGFSAGAVLGVSIFDLLPESTKLSGSIDTTTLVLAIGFVLFMLVDRFFLLHSHDHDNCANENHRGKFGAGALSVHSLLDGVGIGLAFKVSPAVGIVVAIAVLAHDFSDGLNTVNVVLKNEGSRHQAFGWLFVDALAPVVGVLLTFLFTVSDANLGKILALFAGFFLYIGASDILPESHHRHPTYWTTILTVLGLLTLYMVIHFAF